MIVRILRDHLAFGVTFHVELAPLHIKEGVGNLESHFRIVVEAQNPEEVSCPYFH